MEIRGEGSFFLRIRSVLIQSIIKFYLILKKLRDNVKKKIKIDFFAKNSRPALIKFFRKKKKIKYQ